MSLVSATLAGGFLTTGTAWESQWKLGVVMDFVEPLITADTEPPACNVCSDELL